MKTSKNIFESKTDKDPALRKLKGAVKDLSSALSAASKSSEGKALPSSYWVGLVKLVKKAKVGVSMIDLGIDDEDEFEDMVEPDDVKLKKTGPITKADTNEPTTSKSESVEEDANSKSQQRLFGMVHAYNKGELNKSDVGSGLYTKVKKIANNMSDSDA